MLSDGAGDGFGSLKNRLAWVVFDCSDQANARSRRWFSRGLDSKEASAWCTCSGRVEVDRCLCKSRDRRSGWWLGGAGLGGQ